jgi:hypothetical protein
MMWINAIRLTRERRMAVVEQNPSPSNPREVTPRLAPSVDSLLASLRARIRRYVWVEGLAATVAVAIASFWLSMGIDWLFEPPVVVRRLLIAAGAIATAVVFYRFVLRRVNVPFTEANLALLLERRYRELNDGLLTSVNLTRSKQDLGPLGREMLAHTCDEAALRTQKVKVDEVFNRAPLARAAVAAGVLIVSIAGFAIASPGYFRLGVERLSGVTDEGWPRQTRLVVPGFENGEKVIAKGDDFNLLVQADTDMPIVPDVVQVRFWSDEGNRGRETTTREGQAVPGQDPFQNYRYTFSSVLSSLTFDVLGGDDRKRNLRLRVVDSPTISEAVLQVEYPPYMKRTPREFPVTGTMQVPLGSRVTVKAKANKDLVRAQIDYPLDQTSFTTVDIPLPAENGDLRSFQFTLQNFDNDKTLSFTLHDTDGIHNRKPFVVSISATPDEPPQMAIKLQGIGSAITPQARLPLVGTIADDYGVDKASFYYEIDGGDPQLQAFGDAPEGRTEITVDEGFEVRDLEPKLTTGQKFAFSAQATDSYHLYEGDDPHTSIGERFQLDVVTPEALRAMLESRELNLRQRFEQVIVEVTDTRESLSRLVVGPPKPVEEKPVEDKPAGDKPAAESEKKEGETKEPATDGAGAKDAAAVKEDAVATNRLIVERARQNGEKNSAETLGVAEAFDGIREELVNNRVDTEELKIRLKDQIADPLKVIGSEMFPEFERRLKTLQDQLADPALSVAARKEALAQADVILVAMEAVRDKMMELESFNEAIELLRGIMDSEKKLQEETRRRQKEKLRDLQEDDK